MTRHTNIETKKCREVQRLMSTFAGQGVSPEFFYLTGYEGIFVEAGRTQLCECVISSVVSLNSELLLIVDSNSFDTLESMCEGLGIYVTLIDASKFSASDVELILADNKDISHIMSLGVTDRNILLQMGAIAKAAGRSYVVESIAESRINMSDLDLMNIDYLLQSSADSDDMSLVIARRSKLVQAEGNARRPNQDIYAMWQSSVAVRSSSLKPMYI